MSSSKIGWKSARGDFSGQDGSKYQILPSFPIYFVGAIFLADAFVVDAGAVVVDADAVVVDADAVVVDADAFVVDANAFLVDANAFLVDANAFLVDAGFFFGGRPSFFFQNLSNIRRLLWWRNNIKSYRACQRH